jgi:hypothetical protein
MQTSKLWSGFASSGAEFGFKNRALDALLQSRVTTPALKKSYKKQKAYVCICCIKTKKGIL